METPNLEAVVERYAGDATMRSGAISELAALRRRAEDLELMLKAALRGELTAFEGGLEFKLWTAKPMSSLDASYLKSESEYVPLLTDEARAALEAK